MLVLSAEESLAAGASAVESLAGEPFAAGLFAEESLAGEPFAAGLPVAAVLAGLLVVGLLTAGLFAAELLEFPDDETGLSCANTPRKRGITRNVANRHMTQNITVAVVTPLGRRRCILGLRPNGARRCMFGL